MPPNEKWRLLISPMTWGCINLMSVDDFIEQKTIPTLLSLFKEISLINGETQQYTWTTIEPGEFRYVNFDYIQRYGEVKFAFLCAEHNLYYRKANSTDLMFAYKAF